MKYTIKAGVLYKNESQLALVRIKSALLGPKMPNHSEAFSVRRVP